MTHLIDFLKSTAGSRHIEGSAPRVEYRLLCSGALRPANLIGDFSRSDGARVLLRHPFVLVVASDPFTAYPQELILTFNAVPTREESDVGSLSYPTDRQIASDFAALLTLLSRRLVTVAVKSRERYDTTELDPVLADRPLPLIANIRPSYWEERSSIPPPAELDDVAVQNLLRELPSTSAAQDVLRAAKLYASAMERIESDVDGSYQLLVYAVETIAGPALKDWEPNDEEKLKTSHDFVRRAVELEKIPEDVAKRLALEATRNSDWIKKKFVKFLIDNVDAAELGRSDDLFDVPSDLCPTTDELEKAFGNIYNARSQFTHSGRNYPPSARAGVHGGVPLEALAELKRGKRPFPSVLWFERVVNCVVRKYIGSLGTP